MKMEFITVQKVPRHKKLRRMCRGCDEMFHPLGKYSRFCDDCLEERKNKRWVKSLKCRYN